MCYIKGIMIERQRGILFGMIGLALSFIGYGQSSNPYHINGSAMQENCNCYTLTPDANTRSGSVWNIYKIDLTKSFDFNFNVFLGCSDAMGADGIAFVLQPLSTSIGSTGGGLGIEGISPSIAVVIDTWQNTYHNDPSYDHVAIHRNGNINHATSDNLAGPVMALADYNNIEDCKWHTFRIIWNAEQKILKAEIDGIERVQTATDLIQGVFRGDPNVFWGFTGSTGGSKNHQRFCTSLNPQFSMPSDQETCFPALLNFRDESASFGSILKWYWDFGDGTTDSVQTPPAHSFAQPGDYNVKLKILGNNGCVSEAFEKQIIIGSTPVAHFKQQPLLACEKDSVYLLDSSYVQFGTINSWDWSISGQKFSGKNVSIPSKQAGNFPVQLSVTTKEGCVAETEINQVIISAKPDIDFSMQEACLGDPFFFNAINLRNEAPIANYNWKLGDGNRGRGEVLSYLYKQKGKYQVELTATAVNGCISQSVIKSVNVYGTKAFAGNDTVVAINQPLALKAGGGDTYNWSPPDGLDNPRSDRPVAILQKNATYILTASSPFGCETSDTINIKVYKGPEFYLPNAFTPNGDKSNDVFRPVAVGMRTIDLFHIYNRYGQLVFSGNNSDGWNGELKGIKQSTGSYIWMIRGIDYTGKQHFKKGTVILIR